MLGARVGGTNVFGNASIYTVIESIGEGDLIFEAPEQLTINEKVRGEVELPKNNQFLRLHGSEC